MNKEEILLPFLVKGRIEAGCDEAGRGCLAGPVVAAAVILPPDWSCPGLTDSKKLTAKQRENLAPLIFENAIAAAVGIATHEEIDKINILNASYLAMHRALDQLKLRPQHVLVDGNRFKSYKNLPHTCIVKGDSIMLSIAAASILAKTHRDHLMEELHEKRPEYNWIKNKGYPTPDHQEALRKYGQSPWHRRSFHLKSEQLKLEI